MRFFSIAAFALLTLVGCEKPCENEILVQELDQSRKVEFVYVRGNCGATTSYSHKIYVIPTGKNYDDYEPVFIADKVANLNIEWLAQAKLRISYESARIFKFTNFWQSGEVDNFNYEIKISLHEGT